MRIALVSCAKGKRDHPVPARDLYVSRFFSGYRRYAEAHADVWYILSAEHGLVHPEQVLGQYDTTLNSMPAPERRAWAERVIGQLRDKIPVGARIILLAGQRYRENIERYLVGAGHPVDVPFRGLRIGIQLRRLKEEVR